MSLFARNWRSNHRCIEPVLPCYPHAGGGIRRNQDVPATLHDRATILFRYLELRFGTDRHGDAEHTGFFRCKNGRLKFEISRQDLSYPARRPNRRTVKATLPIDRFGLDKERLRLYARSQLNGQFGDQTFFDEIDQSPHLHPYKS